MKKITDALKKFDTSNDNHWNEDGSINEAALKVASNNKVTIEQVKEAFPNFNRANTSLETKTQTSNEENNDTEEQIDIDSITAGIDNASETLKAMLEHDYDDETLEIVAIRLNKLADELKASCNYALQGVISNRSSSEKQDSNQAIRDYLKKQAELPNYVEGSKMQARNAIDAAKPNGVR